MTGDPFAVVKECKGAALSILVLLATNHQLGGGAVTQEWLERHSGYTDKTVSQALVYLQETRRIVQTSAGWVLTVKTTRAGGPIWEDVDTSCPSDAGPVPASRQTGKSEQTDERGAPLERSSPVGKTPSSVSPQVDGSEPAPERGSSLERSVPAEKSSGSRPAGTGGSEQAVDWGSPPEGSDRVGKSPSPKPAPTSEVSRNYSDSSTTTSAIDPGIIKREAEEEGGVGIIPTPINLKHVEANLAAFKKWGVGRNEKTILLSAQPEVTPRQIEAIARQLVSEKRFSTGLLITVVQSGDQPATNLPNKYAPRPKERDPAEYAKWEE